MGVGAGEVETPNGKVLGTASGWGKVSSWVSPSPPISRSCAEAPEENLCPGPKIKRFRNKSTRASYANVLGHYQQGVGEGEGPEF